MSFFKEWDFYYVPKTDYNPKWINYKYKNKKFYNNMCKTATALNWKFQCDAGRYNYRGLCYSEDAAMKPEMLNNPDDYHCGSDWNVRDLNLYQVDKATCGCGICCPVKKVSSYDPSIFKPIATIIKSIQLVCQDKDRIYCDQMNKVFQVKIDTTKITNWFVLDTLTDIFTNKSSADYDNIAYLNFIGLLIVKFYMMMNVADSTPDKTFTNLSTFKTHIPVFMVFRGTTNEGLSGSVGARNYSLSFYKQGLSAGTTSDGRSQYIFNQSTIKKGYLTLGGVAIPASNLTFKNIGSQGIFLVSPTQFCQDQATTNRTVADAMPKYVEGTAILYLVYYNMNDLRLDQPIGIVSDFKAKYIDNPNLVASPQARAWNEYVYYNHLLPNICYGVETNSGYCNPITDYNASPPTPVRQNCSLTTSDRLPDCKTYLLADVAKKQPLVNQTRTYPWLDSKQKEFCNGNNTLECQCYNREQQNAFKSFQGTDYALPTDMKNAVGCWYKPCLDDPNSNIFIESNFRAEKRNCPQTVCQNVVTVMNRPENTANFSNLELRNSCAILSTYTPAPTTTAAPTTTPTPETEPDATLGPPPMQLESVAQEGGDQEEESVDVNKIYVQMGVYIVVFILLVSGVIVGLTMRPQQQQGVFRTLFRTLFGTLWVLPMVLIGIVAFLISSYVRVLVSVNAAPVQNQ